MRHVGSVRSGQAVRAVEQARRRGGVDQAGQAEGIGHGPQHSAQRK
ncbi:hypothetical protein ACFPN7_23525 [Amycolatopsis halotolerans]